jgi:hypothetical protein
VSYAFAFPFCFADSAIPQSRFFVAEAREKALVEACAGYVKESLYREADFWAIEAEAAAKRVKSEVADLTKVLQGKGKELDDVIAEH